MRGSLFLAILGLLHIHIATAYVYRVVVSTAYGQTTDRVSIILVGQNGQTAVHDLPGAFRRNTDRVFTINDRYVGQLTAVKIRLVQKGLWQDYWNVKQVSVIQSRPRRVYIFSFNDQVKYQWNTISQKCRDGFKKTFGGKCVDIDECKESGGCKDKVATCHNTIGSFTCSCPDGYTTNYLKRCEDVNECRKNHGGCEESCHNTPGSYHCGCYRSGYRLADGYRCEDIDECQEGTDNCDKSTTTCRNYDGWFHCICKPGHEYTPDRTTCKRRTCPEFNADRVPHGTLEPARCFQKGQNKFEDNCTVVCDHGYVPNTPANKIATCGKDGGWVPIDSPTYCTGRPCPFLNDIKNGNVQDVCKLYTKRYGASCTYDCDSKYRLKGNSYRECQANGTWSGNEPTCERVYPKPHITCHGGITVVLKPGMSTADISDKWRIPTANVKNITAVSPPGVNSSYQFPYGNTIVRWVAVNEIGETDTCEVKVDVQDHEKPKVVFCPDRIFKVSFSSSPVWVNISRPIFSDNVGIVSYRPALIDGKYLGHRHDLYFAAYDASGNKASCDFTVYVGGYRCQLPPEGPPDGSWSCSNFGNQQFCHRSCPNGQKIFGTPGWWLCRPDNGKWEFHPHPRPVAHCVGYKDVNTSVPCDVGSIRNSSFGFLGCYECPAGTYYKSDACEACTEGSYQDKPAQTSCKTCPAGKSSKKGSYECRPVCPPGRYSKDGFGPFCDFCSNGTYQDKAQQTSCVACPKGTYTLHIGATFCGKSPQITKLEPGSVASANAGGTLVLKCFSQGEPTPSVYWQYPANGKGSKTQQQMKDKDGNPTGTQLTITNADSSDDGDYTCTSANTHGEVTRSVHVTISKASSKRSTLQETITGIEMDDFVPRAADQCPAGKFSSDGLGPLCRVCPKNSYQDQPGKTSCKNCEHGTETLQLAATSAEACGVAPVITSVNSSVNTTGKEAVLDCFAHASPASLVGWRFTEDVPSEFLGIPKFIQLVGDKGAPVGTRMIIRAVTEFNTGRYECTAVNPFGQDKKTLDLKVQ